MSETVSLRNLPATIVDLVGLEARLVLSRPVAGQPVAADPRPIPLRLPIERAISELTGPNPPIRIKVDHRLAGPLISLAEGDFVYIRNEGDGSEELFNERDDPRELQQSCAGSRPCNPFCKRFANVSPVAARP